MTSFAPGTGARRYRTHTKGTTMAKLSYHERVKMTKKSFAFPEKKTKSNPAGKGGYPLDTANRARSALSRGAHNLSPEKDAELKRKVHRRYPNMKIKGGNK